MVYELFTRSMELPSAERQAFLHSQCSDESILAQVFALLSATDAEGNDEFTLAPEFAQESDVYLYHAPLKAGDRISVYQITHELGRGGMGTVYQAERIDGEFEQTVAIKVIAPHIQALFDTHKLANEANFMAKLKHGNICTVFDAGITASGFHYVVMECIDGISVVDYAHQRKLTIKQRLCLFMSICNAVQYAHQHQIIHADIKAQNILIDEFGEPRIVDFGIAKLFDVNRPDVTSYYQAFSADYASPELMVGGHVSILTDIYSLGRLLTVLLNNDKKGQVKDKLKHYHNELAAICHKATQENPAFRYQSVTELTADVSLFTKGFVSQVYPATPWYRFKKFTLLRHPVVSAVSSLFLGLVIALGFQLYYNQVELTAQHKQQTLISNKLSSFLALLNPLKNNTKNLDSSVLLNKVYAELNNDDELSSQSKAKIKLALADSYRGLDDITLSEQLYLEVINSQKDSHNSELLYQAARQLSNLYNLKYYAETVIKIFAELALPFVDESPKTLHQALFYNEYLKARSYVEDGNYPGPAMSLRKILLKDIFTLFKVQLAGNALPALQFELAKLYFNELPSNQFFSHFQVPIDQFEKQHKPQLFLVKDMLKKAEYEAREQNNLNLQAQILSFKARINAELDLQEEAKNDLVKAKQILSQVVGEQHTEMVQYHTMGMIVNYYVQPHLSIKAVRDIVEIIKKKEVMNTEDIIYYLSDLYRLLSWVGQSKEANLILNEAVELYNKYIEADNNFYNTSNMIGMLFNYVDTNQAIHKNQILEKNILKKLKSSNTLSGKFYSSRNNFFTLQSKAINNFRAYLIWYEKYLRSWKDELVDPHGEYINKYDAIRLNWIESFGSSSSSVDSQQVLTALTAFTWSEQEDRYSADKVDVILTAAETLVHIAEPEPERVIAQEENSGMAKAQTLLDQAEQMLRNIPLKEGNSWQARLFMVQGELALKSGNMKQAKAKLLLAKPLLENQFPEDSLYLSHLKELLPLVDK